MVRLAEQQQQLSCEHVCMLLKRSTGWIHPALCARCMWFESTLGSLLLHVHCEIISKVRCAQGMHVYRYVIMSAMLWKRPSKLRISMLSHELALTWFASALIDVLNSMEWSVCAGQVLFKFKQFQLITTFAADLSKHSQWFLNISKSHSHCPALYSCCVFQ